MYWVEWFSKCLSDVGFGLRGFHLGNYSLDIVQARTDPEIVGGEDSFFKGIKRLGICWVLKIELDTMDGCFGLNWLNGLPCLILR